MKKRQEMVMLLMPQNSGYLGRKLSNSLKLARVRNQIRLILNIFKWFVACSRLQSYLGFQAEKNISRISTLQQVKRKVRILVKIA